MRDLKLDYMGYPFQCATAVEAHEHSEHLAAGL